MTELEKLKHLLEHWIEHNDAHVRTYDEWADKADALGRSDLAQVLREIANETGRLDELLKKAIDIM
jgi:rubrerythrin